MLLLYIFSACRDRRFADWFDQYDHLLAYLIHLSILLIRYISSRFDRIGPVYH